MPRLSFILPIYKVESYLPRAIESIMSQTCGDWEAILVDDGSPDNCGRICDEAAAVDSRFRVVHKKNAGSGLARNTGLDMAQGEFIHFLDPDDFVEPDFVEKVLVAADREHADVVMFGFFYESMNDDGTLTRMYQQKPKINGTFSYKEFQNEFVNLITYHYIWNKIYRRELLERWNCRFSSHTLGQDAVFNVRTYANPFNCLVAIDEPYYHYVVREGSSVNRYHEDRVDNNFYITKEIANVVRKWGLDKESEYVKALEYSALRDLNLGIKNIGMSPMSYRERCKWLRNIMKNKELRSTVSHIKVKSFHARNDRIKIILLKLHLYDMVMLLTSINDNVQRGTKK